MTIEVEVKVELGRKEANIEWSRLLCPEYEYFKTNLTIKKLKKGERN